MSTDWARVYRECYQDVLRFLHRKVWDVERARDLAQEAFARALGHDPDNPRAWVFQVAANLARDEARLVVRRKRHLSLLKTEAEVTGEAARTTPHDELARRESAARLQRCLDGLSERDREVILLWDAGLAYDEIAEHTGLARGAVGTTLARAKKKLVQQYDELEQTNDALG